MDAIVINSISVTYPGFLIPPKTHLVEFEHPVIVVAPASKSPKSCVLPVDDIVINAISLEALPPAIIPRTELAAAPGDSLPLVKSPKSCAAPCAAMVM